MLGAWEPGGHDVALQGMVWVHMAGELGGTRSGTGEAVGRNSQVDPTGRRVVPEQRKHVINLGDIIGFQSLKKTMSI